MTAALPKIMHGLWGMGQMMFTKYLVVVDGDVDVHTSAKFTVRQTSPTATRLRPIRSRPRVHCSSVRYYFCGRAGTSPCLVITALIFSRSGGPLALTMAAISRKYSGPMSAAVTTASALALAGFRLLKPCTSRAE